MENPHPLKNGIEGGGTPGISFMVPFSLYGDYSKLENFGDPSPLPLKVRGDAGDSIMALVQCLSGSPWAFPTWRRGRAATSLRCERRCLVVTGHVGLGVSLWTPLLVGPVKQPRGCSS